jgi:hypothetical protein
MNPIFYIGTRRARPSEKIDGRLRSPNTASTSPFSIRMNVKGANPAKQDDSKQDDL